MLFLGVSCFWSIVNMILKSLITECWKDKFMEHLVSIVVPVYNAERYLCTSIHALQKQDYSNIEIYFSRRWLKRCVSVYLRFVWKRKISELGLYIRQMEELVSARNAGIEAATGKIYNVCGQRWSMWKQYS